MWLGVDKNFQPPGRKNFHFSIDIVPKVCYNKTIKGGWKNEE